MGVTIYAKGCPISFDTGYGGFARLRTNLAYALDKGLGDVYNEMPIMGDEYKNWVEKANNFFKDRGKIFKPHKLFLNFLFAPDCGGRCSPKACKDIWETIKDVDFGNKAIRYATFSKPNDYEEFKQLLEYCWKNKKYMLWC